MNTLKMARNIVETSIDACGGDNSDYILTELKELLQATKDSLESLDGDDFTIDLFSSEVRVIHEKAIDAIWIAESRELIEECYDVSDVPSFVVIDWKLTVERYMEEGTMGSHFSPYNEEEYRSGNYYIFRTG